MNLRSRESPGYIALIAALSAGSEPTAIIGSPHMTSPAGGTVRTFSFVNLFYL
jgi:hypothetical protein